AAGVPGDRIERRLDDVVDADALALRGELGGGERGVDDGGQVHRARLDAQLARDDAGDVEQVVDELGQRLRAALDHAGRAGGGRFVELLVPQELGPDEDR